MRILVVGGAGDMGRVACATAVGDPEISSVVIADVDGGRAQALSDDLRSKSSALELDITDAAALEKAVRDVDMVLNTVGPFYRFGRPVLEAALKCGKHYADIADDWEPTIDMLDLDPQAQSAGVSAIIGIGASPGVSNLLATVAHAQLDEVESLHTVWRGGSGVPKVPDDPAQVNPSAAIDHWIHNLAAPIRVWRNGQLETSDALERLEIVYPGIGAADVWTCGHPEPITLPRTFPNLTHSLNLMFARPGLIEAARKVRDRVRTGELTVPDASKEFLLMPGRRGSDAGTVPAFPGVFAYAQGTRGGRPARVAVSANVLPTGGMAESTCIPLAIAAGMVARGEVTKTGAMAPEACVDPSIFFARLASFAGARAQQPPLDIIVESL